MHGVCIQHADDAVRYTRATTGPVWESDTAPHPLRADARRAESAHSAVHIQAHHVEVEVLVREDRR